MKRQIIEIKHKDRQSHKVKAYIVNDFLAIHHPYIGDYALDGFNLTHRLTGYKLAHADTKKQLVARIPRIMACGVSLDFTDPKSILNRNREQAIVLRNACQTHIEI